MSAQVIELHSGSGVARRLARQISSGKYANADDAAWGSLAEACERALEMPGLSDAARRSLEECKASCWRAAGSPRWRES